MNEEMENTDTVIDLGEDLSDIKEFDPLPAGRYQASIEAVEVKTSKSGGKYINVRLSVGTDQYPVDYINDSSTSVFSMISLSDNHFAQLARKKFYEAAGLPLSGKIDIANAIGAIVNINTKLEEYEGTTKVVVKSIEKA